MREVDAGSRQLEGFSKHTVLCDIGRHTNPRRAWADCRQKLCEGRAEGLACHEPGSHSRDGIARQKRGYPETECFSKDVSQPISHGTPMADAAHSCLIHELFNGVIYKSSVNPDRNY